MSIGENIRIQRKSIGMTQEDLANAIGIGRSMVAQIERGSKVPNMMLGRDIARALGCRMEKLLEEV
ncbi:helix-turn-helix transcriptional regulator [Lachnospiraceae bacterium 38-10]